MDTVQKLFIGRQPIVDTRQCVVAYELLFRSSAAATAAVFAEQQNASVRVIANTFSTLGVNAVLGSSRGFFNVTYEVLMSEVIESMPRERVVVEVLENVRPTDEVIARCAELKEMGFSLALDDWVPDDPRRPLLEYAEVIKVDLPAVPPDDLKRMVRRLRRGGRQLLAEKVETREEFDACASLGFDLFQGYYFARPVVLEGASLDSNRATLLELLQKLQQEAPTEEIVDTLKRNVNLGLSLLHLVNSAALATRNKIGRIEDAVNYFGRLQLKRWITIMLFAGEVEGGMRSPLLLTAAHRGRLMEQSIARATDDGASETAMERAFLVGMLSLVDVLLSRPMEEIALDLSLDDEIRRALLKRTGTLGRLLFMIECMERAEFDAMAGLAGEFGLTLGDLQDEENLAYAWVHDFAGS